MSHDEAIIEHQIAALRRLMFSVFALLGLAVGGPALSSMSANVRRKVLRVLQPAESALRRMIFLRARGLSVALGPKRSAPLRAIPKGNGSSDRVPPFALFDPRKWIPELAKSRRFQRGFGPRISGFDEARPVFEAVAPASKTTNPAKLCKRLQALHQALENIPAQAKRLAILQAKRRAAGETIRRTMPLRPGAPPGHRKHRSHIVDDILYEFDLLARREPRPPG